MIKANSNLEWLCICLSSGKTNKTPFIFQVIQENAIHCFLVKEFILEIFFISLSLSLRIFAPIITKNF